MRGRDCSRRRRVSFRRVCEDQTNKAWVLRCNRSLLTVYRHASPKRKANALDLSPGGPRRRPVPQRCPLGLILTALQPAGHVFGVIGKNNRGSGALNTGENFQHDALLVDPTPFSGGFDHRKFSTDVVSSHWHIKALTDARDDIEIWQCGLDHYDVCALFKIQRDFAQSLTSVRGVHLVAAPVSE